MYTKDQLLQIALIEVTGIIEDALSTVQDSIEINIKNQIESLISNLPNEGIEKLDELKEQLSYAIDRADSAWNSADDACGIANEITDNISDARDYIEEINGTLHDINDSLNE